ncbi:MAG: hypothetical protein Q9212_007167 [Teloschistes hypoglaucus]
MSLLSDLPNEVAEVLVGQVYREDLVNLATTCKWMHALSQPGLKTHRDLQRKYGQTLSITANDDLLVQLTIDVIKNFRVGLYVTKLCIVECFHTSRQAPLRFKCSEYTLSLLQGAATDKLPLPATLIRKAVRSVDQTPVVALLLQLLPNLRTLQMHMSSWHTSTWYSFLQATLDKADPRTAARRKELPCLSKLNSVDLFCSGPNSFDTFERFRKIPSLRILRVRGLSVNRTNTEMNHRAWDGLCTVKALIFMKCEIETTLMSPILESQCGVEYFSYTSIELVENDDTPKDGHLKASPPPSLPPKVSTVQPDPYWVRLSLSATSRDSLQVFQYLPHAIVSDAKIATHAHRYLGSLKGFSSLRTVMVDFCLLFGGALLGRRTFMTELPRSIRNVLLYIPPNDTLPVVSAEVLRHHLHWLLRGKTEHLPTISNVLILGLGKEVVRAVLACAVIKALRSEGVEVTLVERTGKVFQDFQLQIKSDGFYHEKPWYYEGIDF